MFLQIDGTFVVQLINFAIFFAILNVVFMRPVSKAIIARRDYINSVTNDYDRYQAERSALCAEAESIRAAARREAEHALSKTRAEASNEAAAIATQYAQQATQKVEEAHRTVEAELQTARANEARTAAELADLMVERTLTGAAK